jgi:thiol peroxidase
MAETKFGGNPVHTVGELPAVGSPAPAFELAGGDLSNVTLSDFSGRRLVLNIFPSIDTPTCAASVRRFNELAASMENTTVLNVSADLPFAQSRFCGAEGIDKVQSASTFRNGDFGDTYGVRVADSKLAGLMARAVVVVDEQGQVSHTELVPDIAQEPDYDAALTALK